MHRILQMTLQEAIAQNDIRWIVLSKELTPAKIAKATWLQLQGPGSNEFCLVCKFDNAIITLYFWENR
ncbi:hypothetical protein HNY73_018268 [Argiope bruennichi]|uniref:Uncharacterized protein n=1 Tax=Argiope bruennichi TaxID=94029 RepID=A0A8T0EDD7_ARGBR|nr:hypothetical protein HNY73_018268 [Argiope bruennichi]